MSAIAMDTEVSVRHAAGRRRVRPRRVSRGGVVRCAPDSPVRTFSGSIVWRRVRVAVVSVIAVAGAVVGVAGYVDAVAGGPAGEPAPAAGAWAHVE